MLGPDAMHYPYKWSQFVRMIIVYYTYTHTKKNLWHTATHVPLEKRLIELQPPEKESVGNSL